MNTVGSCANHEPQNVCSYSIPLRDRSFNSIFMKFIWSLFCLISIDVRVWRSTLIFLFRKFYKNAGDLFVVSSLEKWLKTFLEFRFLAVIKWEKVKVLIYSLRVDSINVSAFFLSFRTDRFRLIRFSLLSSINFIFYSYYGQLFAMRSAINNKMEFLLQHENDWKNQTTHFFFEKKNQSIIEVFIWSIVQLRFFFLACKKQITFCVVRLHKMFTIKCLYHLAKGKNGKWPNTLLNWTINRKKIQ